jgi:hypothetical protein
VALLPEVFGDQVFLGIESYTEQALLVADGGEEVGAGHGRQRSDDQTIRRSENGMRGTSEGVQGCEQVYTDIGSGDQTIRKWNARDS